MSGFRDASLHGEERSHGACLGILLLEHLFPTVLTFHTCLLPTALWSAREGHSCCLVVGNRSQVSTWLRATGLGACDNHIPKVGTGGGAS